MKNKKIAVVLGGPSAEREVSLRTGTAIHKALLAQGYDAVIIDLDPANFTKQLAEQQIDIVFNAVHGLYGEDGCMQGQLDMLGIKYTGSGVLASSVAMDKIISKRIFLASGIPTPDFIIIEKKEITLCIHEILARFSLPVVIKPPAQGSSVGVEIVKNTSDLQRALLSAFEYADELLVEEFIQGRELTAAVLKTAAQVQALPLVEIAPHSGVYDYTSKYTVGATDYLVPAPLEENIAAKIQDMAKQAFCVLGCKGVARADIMLSGSQAYVLEINTVPGMTETSLVPKAAAAIGMSFEQLCEQILLDIK